MEGYAAGVDDARTPYRLRVHQQQALDALAKAETDGRRRAWVVLPPGAGKTLVGLETAARRGARTVVLGPNTAIQSQWLQGWEELNPGRRAGSRRDLDTMFTALTYQSLATFATDEEEEAGDEPLLNRLHPHGRALVERLKAIGDLTLILDECHHLLEVWGRLVQGVLDELPDAFVLGLTATPPGTLTADQKALVDDLFGETVFSVSIPAVVREGDLAPYAELAWLTTPTTAENDWLAEQGLRFAELTTALTDPSTGFLQWLDRRFSTGAKLAPGLTDPGLADAALRMVHVGLLTTPPGARLTEAHRRQPTADDWVLLIDEWLGSTDDDAIIETIRRVLPSVGYQLTGRGIRRGRSPVDRVLARSE